MKITRHSQRGLTLIELLISMTLGVFLIGGMLQILVSTRQAYNLQEGLSRLQENGRFAMNNITRDVRMTGFLGCRRIADVVPANVANTAMIAAVANTIVTGTDNVTNNWNATMCSSSNRCIAGTDSITVINATSCGANLTTAMLTTGDNISIPVGNTCGIAVGTPLILANCSNSDLFLSTSIGTPISHAALNNAYASDAEILNYNVITYYIRTGANGGNSLWRYDNNMPVSTTNPVEVTEGIENMQISYGADIQSPQDGCAEYYVPAGTAGLNMNQVVSTRISLLVTSTSDNLVAKPAPYNFNGLTVTPTDRKIRRVFTSTIALRNLLP